jgi:hypothetical protein
MAKINQFNKNGVLLRGYESERKNRPEAIKHTNKQKKRDEKK